MCCRRRASTPTTRCTASSSSATPWRGSGGGRCCVAEQEAGRARDDIDVDRLSTEVLGVLLGIEHQWLMDADRVDIVAVALGYLDRLRDSIAP